MSKFNIQKAISKAAKTTNLNEARSGGGGGNYVPPATGVPGLRFVAYVEVGPQEKTWEGKTTVRPQAILTFELHGKKWPLSENGQPQRLNVKLTAPKAGEQPHTKSTYYKLFKQMNYADKYNHFAEMLGDDFIGTVYHKVDKKDPKKVYPGFVDPLVGGVPSIRAPFVEDEDGEPRRRKVPDTISELRCFLWQFPDADQWASIYIEGEYDDGKSKNTYQNLIKASPGFEGSPIEAILLGLDPEDDEADDPEAVKKAAKARKAKQAEPVDDDDEDGTNDIPENDEPAFDPDEEDEPAETTRTKKAAAKRAPVKKAKPAPAPVEDDEDEDDPLADIGGDDDE